MVIDTIDEPGLPGETAAPVMLVPGFRFHQDETNTAAGVVFRMLKQWYVGRCCGR